MKILYLIDRFETNHPRDQNYIIKYMMERGHEITIITSDDAKFKRFDSVFFPKASFIRAPIIGKLRRATLHFHPLMLKSLLKEFDVAHAFTFFTTSSVLGALANANTKVLRSEIGPLNGPTFAKSKQKLSIYSYLTRIYKGLYDYITVYNHVEARSLLALGFDKQKVVLVSPMIDYYSFSKLAKTGIDRDEIVLGSIARLSPEKGVHRLIPLVRGLLRELRNNAKNFRMLLAGRIDNLSYGHKVLLELRRLLRERFTYLGEVAPPYRFYEMVDIVIVPSIIETGAISVLEALAAGKVVVASNIYPINLYIRHGTDGFLFTKIPEAVNIVKSILNGNEDVEYLKKSAQEKAKCYDYRLVCSKLERVYRFGKD